MGVLHVRQARWVLLSMGVLALVASLGSRAAAAQTPPAARVKVPLGVTYSGWKGGFKDADARIATFAKEGFRLVTLVPAYAYVGLDRIDVTAGPDRAELGHAIEVALGRGLEVVIKPHLEPLVYSPGYSRAKSDNHSWRAECGWRGFFDLDPMTPDYRQGIVQATLEVLGDVIGRLELPEGTTLPAIRLDLGAELMNSTVYKAASWERLLRQARQVQRRLGLVGKVQLSHNFSHHFAILEDFVGRMAPADKRALGRYIQGLDAVAISQYMDLTVAVPDAERGTRVPTVAEVAEALRIHERNLRTQILQGALGLPARRIPPFHVGEFGVGAGGLRHPNLWSGVGTPAEERALQQEVAVGHAGLIEYLSNDEGRTARSAVLWVTGRNYDIFGWKGAQYAIPAAADAIRAGIRPAP